MIAYRVVAVPERIEHARRLADATGAELVIDHTHEGTFANHIRALASVADASHVVVLEDDAIVCADFISHVERLIEERPLHLLGLYVGRGHPVQPQPLIAEVVQQAPAWLDHPGITNRLRWAVGYAMPTADIAEVLAHLELDGPGRHPWQQTDVRIGRWHAARGRLSYPFPSPIDHNDNIASTTSTHGKGRTAWAHCDAKGVAP